MIPDKDKDQAKTAAPAMAGSDKKTKTLSLNLSSKTSHLLLIGSLGLSVVLFVAILVLGLSLLGKKSNSMVDLKIKTQVADAQLTNLEQAKKQVQKYAYFKDVAKTVIPTDKNQAEDILEINRIADEAGISIRSITFPLSSLGLSTGTTPQDATAKTSAKSVISQAKPVTGISGLYSLELTITPESNNTAPPDKQLSYEKMLDFLNRIENNRHTAQISEVTITPSGNTVFSSGFSFTLKINIFIKP